MAETNDYAPFMDRFPELKLRPVTEFPEHSKIRGFDYVQSLKPVALKDVTNRHGYFHLIVKDGKFGIYMFKPGWLWNTTSVALTPKYDSIDFIFYKDESFGVIVKRDGKYGMYFWTYDSFINTTHAVKAEYDSLVKLDNSRFKAVKDNVVTYFDATGHVLK